MGRAKIKKKDTFIDITAMSDVTVLLLTFFMLTSTFVKKEPVQVTTPASVSEIKIPETDVLQILVDQEGKIFMSLDKQQDMQAVLRVWVKSMASSSLRNRQRGSQWLLRLECLSEVCRNSLTSRKINGTKF